MKKTTIAIAVLAFAFTSNINAADKGATLLVNRLATTEVRPYVADQDAAPVVVTTAPERKQSTFLRSHSKQIGLIGRYEIHQIKVRGLDVPNLSAAVIYDPATEQLLVVGTVGAPGLGGALINSAGQVGAAAVFGRAIRPTEQNISNGSGSTSTSNGGEAIANAEGGSANSKSDSSSKSNSSARSQSRSNSNADVDVDVSNRNNNQNSNQNSNQNNVDVDGGGFTPPGHQGHPHGHGKKKTKKND